MLYHDFASFAARCFRELNPRTPFAANWHVRLSPQRQAVPEFETTAQGSRVATSVGGVLTGRGADIIVIDDR